MLGSNHPFYPPGLEQLFLAIGWGDTQAVKALLQNPDVRKNITVKGIWRLSQGINDVVFEKSKNYALYLAIDGNHIDIVNQLLDIPEVQNEEAISGARGLGIAAERGRLEIVVSLLNIPEVMEVANGNDNYALRYAAKWEYPEILKLLMAVPCVAADAAKGHHSAAFMTFKNKKLDILNYMLQFENVKRYAIENAIKFIKMSSIFGDFSVVDKLIKIDTVYNTLRNLEQAQLRIHFSELLRTIYTYHVRGKYRNASGILSSEIVNVVSTFVNIFQERGIDLSQILDVNQKKILDIYSSRRLPLKVLCASRVSDVQWSGYPPIARAALLIRPVVESRASRKRIACEEDTQNNRLKDDGAEADTSSNQNDERRSIRQRH